MMLETTTVPVNDSSFPLKKEALFKTILKEYLDLFGSSSDYKHQEMSRGDSTAFALTAIQTGLKEKHINCFLLKNFILYKDLIKEKTQNLKLNDINYFAITEKLSKNIRGIEELIDTISIDTNFKSYMQKWYIIYQMQGKEYNASNNTSTKNQLYILSDYINKIETNKIFSKK